MVRKETKPRSSTKRWQRLTAFLTSVAMIAGVVPFQSLTVMADTTEEFEVIFSAVPEMDGLSVEYKFDDQAEWTSIENYIQVTTSDFKFSISNEESNGLSLKFNLGKNNIMSGSIGTAPDDANPVAC